MARDLNVILKELDAGYAPGRALINERLKALPGEAEAEIAGLKGQQTQAFDEILGGARSRGIGFSGIPIQEQAKYTAGTFLPAVARVRQSQNEVKNSLLGSLNDSSLDQRKTALGIRQNEQTLDEQRRQFNEQQAAQRRAEAAQRSLYGSLYGNNNPSAQQQPDLMGSLKSFLQRQYAATPNANRSMQDAWVKIWATRQGIDPNKAGDPNGIWAYYNQLYPWAKYSGQQPTLKVGVAQPNQRITF